MSALLPDLHPMNQDMGLLQPPPCPPKRKRGRPRKNEAFGSENPTKRRSLLVNPGAAASAADDDDLLGQPVHGVLDGSFSAGYLITVQVGRSGPTLKGLVFDPGLSVPVTEGNDIAPHLPFCGSAEFAQKTAASAPPIRCHGRTNEPPLKTESIVFSKGAVKNPGPGNESPMALNVVVDSGEKETVLPPSNANLACNPPAMLQPEVLLKPESLVFSKGAVKNPGPGNESPKISNVVVDSGEKETVLPPSNANLACDPPAMLQPVVLLKPSDSARGASVGVAENGAPAVLPIPSSESKSAQAIISGRTSDAVVGEPPVLISEGLKEDDIGDETSQQISEVLPLPQGAESSVPANPIPGEPGRHSPANESGERALTASVNVDEIPGRCTSSDTGPEPSLPGNDMQTIPSEAAAQTNEAL